MVVLDFKILVPWFRFPPFSPTSIGGLSVSIWQTTRWLAFSGASVSVLCPSEKGNEYVKQIDGVEVLGNSLGKKIIQDQKLEYTEQQQLRHFDLILSVNNLGARSLSIFQPKVVRQIHTVAHDRPVSTYLPQKPGLTDYLKMVVQKRKEMSWEKTLRGSGTICVSEYNLMKMADYKLESSQNLIRIPNGIDAAVFKPANKETTSDLLFIGRFQKLKGFDILLKALSLIAARKVDLSLVVIGGFSKDERNYSLSSVPENLRRNIHFLGAIDHERLPEFINASRVVVVPSRYESFSLPALEAAACGVPVVAFSVGGIPEVLGKENGILVSRISEDSLANEIVNALGSGKLKDSARRFAPKIAIEYGRPTVTKRLLEYLHLRSRGDAKQL